VYMRAELISGGSTAKSMSFPPIDLVGRQDLTGTDGFGDDVSDGAANRDSLQYTSPGITYGRYRAEPAGQYSGSDGPNRATKDPVV